MNPRDVKTIEEARAIIEERGLKNIKVGLFDNDGVMRGKYMSRDKFNSSWEEREYRKHITDWEMERYFEII